MAFIEFGGTRYPVPAGEMVLGSGAGCHLRLEGPGIEARHAILTTGPAPELAVAIRVAEEGRVVQVNGVRLGPLPQPLLHGDKITIGPVELLFADERKSGSTQYISAAQFAKLAPPASGGPAKPVGTTGGRVVSLTDGREYQVGATLRFGREAGADVVVPGGQVSRRHAEIVASPRGYVLIDTSTNGTFVNGDRIENQRILARADVIKIADEEFRFYADVAAPAAAPPAPPPPAAAAQLQSTGYFESPPRPGAPAPAAAAPAAPTAAAPGAASAGPLAKFVVRSGGLKGQRLIVKVPIVNIGRAEYCDIVIPDDSVSSQHAKLTRREGVWVLTDLGSTNGTTVDGERIEGDIPIAPGAHVRFGDVQLVFDPTDDDADLNPPKATRMISALKLQDLQKPPGPSR
jgi:pSer/pThr/pTyr-binding forkhead associated (FHA) protein